MSRSRMGVLVLICAEVEYAVLSRLCFMLCRWLFSLTVERALGGEATRSDASRGHVIYGKVQHAAMRLCGGILRGSKCHNMEGTSSPSGSLYDRLLMREILYKTVRPGYIPPEMRPAVRHLGPLLLDLRHHVMGGDNDPLHSLHSTAIQAIQDG